MKPRPLHRSLIFWSGLFILGFILWAWHDSTKRSISLEAGEWQLHQWASGIAISHDPSASTAGSLTTTDMATLARILGPISDPDSVAVRTEESILFASMRLARPEYYRVSSTEQIDHMLSNIISRPRYDLAFPYLCMKARLPKRGGYYSALDPLTDGWICFIPHWLILLAAAVPWALLLLWREGRIKAKLAKIDTEA